MRLPMALLAMLAALAVYLAMSRIWTRAIAGHHVIFHNDEGQETRQTGIMVYDPNVKGGRPGSVLQRLDWLGCASRFFNESIGNLGDMAPRNDLVHSAEGTYCFANPGVEYAVYSWSGGTFELDLSASAGKALTARFYCPREGTWGEALRPDPDSSVVFRKPDARDWVLHVQATE